MTEPTWQSVLAPVLRLAGTIGGALFGAERTGLYSLKVARENRQADFQRATLIELQDLLPAYSDAAFGLISHAPHVASDDNSFGILPPPTVPYLPDRPEDIREFHLRLLHDHNADRRRIEADLDRLNSRVTNQSIKQAVSDLITPDWYRKDRAGEYEAMSDLNTKRRALNDLIGPEVSKQ